MKSKAIRPTTALFFALVSLDQTGTKADPLPTNAQKLYHAITQNQIETLQTLLQQGQ